MSAGRQILLLRKGGILEQSIKNRFSITHNEFLFFPTYLHQSRGELKPEIQFEPAAAEPDQVRLTAAGGGDGHPTDRIPAADGPAGRPAHLVAVAD